MEDLVFLPKLRNMLAPLSVVVWHGKICHIRGVVDDEYIVYRVWGKHKKRWFYYCEWWYAFHLANEGRNLIQRANNKY